MKAKRWCPTLSVLAIASTKDLGFIIPEVRNSECRKILSRLFDSNSRIMSFVEITAIFASFHELRCAKGSDLDQGCDAQAITKNANGVAFGCSACHSNSQSCSMRQQRLLVCFLLMGRVDCENWLVELSLES